MNFSYGFVETRGYVAAIEAADAMVKAAKVDIVKWRKAGGALVMVVVKGELSACRAAVDAGSAAAARVGELVSSNLIANPFGDTDLLIEQYLGGRKKKVQSASGTVPAKKSSGSKTKIASTEKRAPKKTKIDQPKPLPAKAKKNLALAKPKTKTAQKVIPKKDASFSPQERLLHLIAEAPKGITVNQLAEEFKKPVAEVRQLIKKLMDRNVIEKVQKRYFITDNRSAK